MTASALRLPQRDHTIGRHRLILHIGAGGMGDVYLGLATGVVGFAKLQVIKILRSGKESDPEQVAMFLDEARLAGRLNHPHVVQTNDAGTTEDGRIFLVMEYIEGQPVHRFIAAHKKLRGAPLPLPIYLRILVGALTGLHYAHELADYGGKPLSIVHRDMSPQNIMVTYDGMAKVVDFGIAKASSNVNLTSTKWSFKGKISYGAPEQFCGPGKVDRRADIYAMGVMIWEAIVGRRMWHNVEEMAVYHRVITGSLPDLFTLAPDVAPELARICSRALAREPEDRYSTAADLKADLEVYLDKHWAQIKDREVGALVAEVFQEERAMVRAKIDELINELPSANAAQMDKTRVPSIAAQLGADTLMTPSPTLHGDMALSTGRHARGFRNPGATKWLIGSIFISMILGGSTSYLVLRKDAPSAGSSNIGPTLDKPLPPVMSAAVPSASPGTSGTATVAPTPPSAIVPRSTSPTPKATGTSQSSLKSRYVPPNTLD